TFEQISAEGYSSVVVPIYTPFGQWSAGEDHQETTGLAGRARARRPFGTLEGGHSLYADGWPATHMRARKAHRRHLAEGVDRAAASARGTWNGEPAAQRRR